MANQHAEHINLTGYEEDDHLMVTPLWPNEDQTWVFTLPDFVQERTIMDVLKELQPGLQDEVKDWMNWNPGKYIKLVFVLFVSLFYHNMTEMIIRSKK